MIQNVLIIEDEAEAAKRLQSLIRQLLPGVDILATLDSVKGAVDWFQTHQAPDLALMDIQLADGISFQIFEQCEVKCPVIFTTAYDEYALKAFKVNSVDYILKPVDREDMDTALKKLNSLTQWKANPGDLLESIGKAVNMLVSRHKKRFVIKVGEHLKSLAVSDILYFYSQEKVTFARLNDGKKHILDYTLEQIETLLDPQQFFRISRKYIVSTPAIHDMVSYTNSRLKLLLKHSDDSDVVVARERVQEFKDWLDQ